MPEAFRKIYPLFGKEAEIILFDSDTILSETVADLAYAEGLRLQKIFNYYDKDSELSILNRKKRLKVSKVLLHVITEALKVCRLTDGEYDISLGKQIEQRKAGIGEISPCSYKDIIVSGNMVSLENPNVKIDLGSAAKGYIADRMAELIKKEGIISGYIDARGDILVFGRHSLEVGVQHPRNSDEIIESISIKNAAVATSGDYSQYYGTYEKSHIINKKDLISVTVIASDLLTADLYATAVFVSKKLINMQKSLKILTVDRYINIQRCNGFEKLVCK